MKTRMLLPFILLAAFASLLVGCTAQQRSPEEVKEKTAEATAALKSNAKAVAEGIREGWSRDKPLDLNRASKEDLVSLPGMTSAQADRVITGRPYDNAAQLVTRRIITQSEYDKIADRVTARK